MWVLGMGLKRANNSEVDGWIDGTVAVDIFCTGEQDGLGYIALVSVFLRFYCGIVMLGMFSISFVEGFGDN